MVAGQREYGALARAIVKKWLAAEQGAARTSASRQQQGYRITSPIIPTLEAPKHLSEAEQKITTWWSKRFLAVFYPAAEYLVTTRITIVEQHQFKTEGKVLLEPGWLAVYGKEAQDETASLVKVDAGERVRTDVIEAIALQTKPPARYSEATLLTAMEGAGKLLDDEELRAAMAGRGLGTPATRAQVIEGLITRLISCATAANCIRPRRRFSCCALCVASASMRSMHRS